MRTVGDTSELSVVVEAGSIRQPVPDGRRTEPPDACQPPSCRRESAESLRTPRHAASPQEPSMTSRNLAARAGRWSAGHRKIAIFGWLAFVAIALVGGSAAGLNTFTWQENGPGESGRADKAI